MIRKVARVHLFAPDLDRAVAYYAGLGLRVESDAAGAGGRRVELRFPDGDTRLLLHDDPLRRFPDVDLLLESRDDFARLSLDPDVAWLRGPVRSAGGWTATVRGRDGNILTLSSADP